MQNENTLIEIGFKRLSSGDYLYRGMNCKFIAKVITCNGPTPFVTLYKVSPQIDYRPKSDNYGRHYRSVIKDCCSDGSVLKAIKKYDIK